MAQSEGAAEAVADTLDGRLAVKVIELGEAWEGLGQQVQSTGFDVNEAGVGILKTEVDLATAGIAILQQWGLIPGKVTGATAALETAQATIDRVNQRMDDAAKAAAAEARANAGLSRSFAELMPPADDLEAAIASLSGTMTHAVVDMKDTIKSGKAGIIEQFRDLAWQSKHPFREKNYAEWLQEQHEKALRKAKAAAKAGKPGVAAQYRQLAEDIEKEMSGLPTVAHQNTVAAMNALYPLAYAVGSYFQRGVDKAFGVSPVARAAGGPVRPGGTYIVGEREPELLHMGSAGGYVTPLHQASGGPVQFVYAPQFSSASPAEAERFARDLSPWIARELARQGAGSW